MHGVIVNVAKCTLHARGRAQVWSANSVLQYRYGRLCSQVSEFFELKGMFLRILQWAVYILEFCVHLPDFHLYSLSLAHSESVSIDFSLLPDLIHSFMVISFSRNSAPIL